MLLGLLPKWAFLFPSRAEKLLPLRWDRTGPTDLKQTPVLLSGASGVNFGLPQASLWSERPAREHGRQEGGSCPTSLPSMVRREHQTALLLFSSFQTPNRGIHRLSLVPGSYTSRHLIGGVP